MKVQSIYSHSVFGLFWFDLPLGLLLTFIYHLIVRNQFISNLPEKLNVKLSAFKYFDWVAYFKQNWLIVVISILIGAASHLFWDAFTHPTGYFVERITILKKSLTIYKAHVQIFTILQHLSSLVGGLVVILALLGLKSKQAYQSNTKTIYWGLICLIMIIIFTVRIFTGLSIRLYGNVIVTLISAFLISIILTPLLIRGSAKSPQQGEI